MAGIAPTDIDMVLFATSSPDDIFGSACQVQSALGCKGTRRLTHTHITLDMYIHTQIHTYAYVHAHIHQLQVPLGSI